MVWPVAVHDPNPAHDLNHSSSESPFKGFTRKGGGTGEGEGEVEAEAEAEAEAKARSEDEKDDDNDNDRQTPTRTPTSTLQRRPSTKTTPSHTPTRHAAGFTPGPGMRKRELQAAPRAGAGGLAESVAIVYAYVGWLRTIYAVPLTWFLQLCGFVDYEHEGVEMAPVLGTAAALSGGMGLGAALTVGCVVGLVLSPETANWLQLHLAHGDVHLFGFGKATRWSRAIQDTAGATPYNPRAQTSTSHHHSPIVFPERSSSPSSPMSPVSLSNGGNGGIGASPSPMYSRVRPIISPNKARPSPSPGGVGAPGQGQGQGQGQQQGKGQASSVPGPVFEPGSPHTPPNASTSGRNTNSSDGRRPRSTTGERWTPNHTPSTPVTPVSKSDLRSRAKASPGSAFFLDSDSDDDAADGADNGGGAGADGGGSAQTSHASAYSPHSQSDYSHSYMDEGGGGHAAHVGVVGGPEARRRAEAIRLREINMAVESPQKRGGRKGKSKGLGQATDNAAATPAVAEEKGDDGAPLAIVADLKAMLNLDALRRELDAQQVRELALTFIRTRTHGRGPGP